MLRTMLKSKIHRARVTAADLHYEGSITVDETLLAAADILPYEQVHVLDVDNGARLQTYAIPGGTGRDLHQRRRRPAGVAGRHRHHPDLRPGDRRRRPGTFDRKSCTSTRANQIVTEGAMAAEDATERRSELGQPSAPGGGVWQAPAVARPDAGQWAGDRHRAQTWTVVDKEERDASHDQPDQGDEAQGPEDPDAHRLRLLDRPGGGRPGRADDPRRRQPGHGHPRLRQHRAGHAGHDAPPHARPSLGARARPWSSPTCPS